jgi:uncharacterized paraquat-inducible protein A
VIKYPTDGYVSSLSRKQRERLASLAWEQWSGLRSTVEAAAVCTYLCAYVALYLLATQPWNEMQHWGDYVTFAAISILFIAFHLGVTERSYLRRAFAEYLTTTCPDGRLPNCLECEYDTRGSTGEHCPECGAPIRWRASEAKDKGQCS